MPLIGSSLRPARFGLLVGLVGLALTGVLSLAVIWDRLPFDSTRWPGAEQRADERHREQARAEQSAMAWSRLLDDGLVCGGDMATLWAGRPARDDDTADGLTASARALRAVAERCRSRSPSLRQVWLLPSPERPRAAVPVWADAYNAGLGPVTERLHERLREAVDTEAETYAATTRDASEIDQIVPVRTRPGALLVMRFTPQPIEFPGEPPPRVLDERSLATGVAIAATHGLRVAVSTDLAERRALSLLVIALVLLSSAAVAWNGRRERLYRAALHAEHEQAEEANKGKQRESSFRQDIEDASPVGLRVIDAKGRILEVNRTFADAVGMSPEEIKGQEPPYRFWLEDELTRQKQHLDDILQGRASGEQYQVKLRGPGGSYWTASVKATPLTDGRGWLLTSQDISASLDHQRKVDRLQLELQRQSATEWLGIQAAYLLHELVTQAHAIDRNASNLEVAAEGSMTEPMKVELNGIREVVVRQHQHINEFRRQVKGELSSEWCNLAKLVDDVFVLRSVEAASMNARLINQVNPAHPPQLLARLSLLQTLNNLVGNALQWMGSTPMLNRRVVVGDRVVTDPTSPEHPSGRHWLSLTVEDLGSGIPPVDWERIFESGVSSRPDGQGIGLWLCRWWIERMGGKIEVSASGPDGTVMRIKLPFNPSPEVANDDVS